MFTNKEDLSEFDETTSTHTNESDHEGKRFRTSPRTNAFNEVLAILAQYNNTEGREASDVLNEVAEKVRNLIGTQLVKEDREKRTYTPKGLKLYHGYYVGESSNGQLSVVSLPKGGNIEELREHFTHFYGPWRTKAGAEHRMMQGEHVSDQKF